MTQPHFLSSVLLIDDSDVDRYITSMVIKKTKSDIAVKEFELAENALAFLSDPETPKSELPDLIFLDIRMPEMDGFEFLEIFGTLPDSIKNTIQIIMHSSSISPEDLERASNCRYVKNYISKTLNSEVFLNIVQEYNSTMDIGFQFTAA